MIAQKPKLKPHIPQMMANIAEDLGIDVAADIEAADIAQYSVEIGTRPDDGKVVALGYQATGGAFIYRRSIASDVFGTDDPATITDKIGPGWDKFWSAAEDLKAKLEEAGAKVELK